MSDVSSSRLVLGRSTTSTHHKGSHAPAYKTSSVPGWLYLKKKLRHIDVRSGGRAVERRTVNREDGGSIPPTAVSKLKQFHSPPHVSVGFGRDINNRWSLLSGVYARGSETSHTGGKCVTCSGLTNSREGQLLR